MLYRKSWWPLLIHKIKNNQNRLHIIKLSKKWQQSKVQLKLTSSYGISTTLVKDQNRESSKEQNGEIILNINLEQKAENRYVSQANYSNEITNYKILEFLVIEAKHLPVNTKIKITPYSVNNVRLNLGDRIIFGKEDSSNAFNFPKDENVGIKQFEINYDPSIRQF